MPGKKKYVVRRITRTPNPRLSEEDEASASTTVELPDGATSERDFFDENGNPVSAEEAVGGVVTDKDSDGNVTSVAQVSNPNYQPEEPHTLYFGPLDEEKA